MKQYNDRIIEQIDSPYGELAVVDRDGIRYLLCDGNMESAQYLDENNQELVFPYMQRFSYAFFLHPHIQNTLMIGGGAFDYPRYYCQQYPEASISVVEISEDVITLGKKHFHMNELPKDRCQVIQADGFQYLQQIQQKYDLIINDAFLGKKDIGRSEEMSRLVKDHLQQDGLYMLNATGSIKGFSSFRIKKLVKILKKVFTNVVLMQCEEERSPYEPQNILIVASDSEMF